jgi:cytochrome P450
LAFKVVAKSLFHLSISEEKLKRLQYIIERVQIFLVKEVRLPHKGWWFKLSGQIAKHKTLSEESRKILGEIIEERRASKESHGDLLDMLLATRYEDPGESMTTEPLIDEITILFVAGHETTANALTATTHLLAKHPGVQQKILEEVLQAESETSNPTEQIAKLPYTRAVIDESMRLYPPAWITDRENLEDDTLGDFYIKDDTLVGISFYELHRHPDYWERPNEFLPERFLGEEKKKSTGIYYPFGAGPRMCIGIGFAIFEMVLAVSHLVKKYELSSQKDSFKLNPLITLKPVGVEVKFEKRGNCNPQFINHDY